MAGLIAALFGGNAAPTPPAGSQPGQGGYRAGPGPTGAYGFNGSTSLTRVNRNKTPRQVGVQADRVSGFEQALSTINQVRQQAAGFGQPNPRNARLTPRVATPQPLLTALLQKDPATNKGGLLDTTTRGARTVGGNPMANAAEEGGHNVRDTTTPWTKAQPEISGNVPGAQNVRNQIAQHYKAVPGQLHTYKSAPRADQAGALPSGWAADGNVHPEKAVTEVTVPNRYLWPGAGGAASNQSWSVLREMPYGGRGDGARGAALNGQRFYATGQEDQFWNAGQGDLGIARRFGGKRPVAFEQPAPWTSQFYDTTPGVQNATANQAPDMVYVSPQVSRRNTATRGI